MSHRDAFQITYQLTFSTERKWMGTFGVSPRTGQGSFHIKGAPELVLARCTQVRTNGGVEPLDAHRAVIQDLLKQYQARGMRTLGLAYRDDMAYQDGVDIDAAAQQLVWLGFVAIADPVRPEVPPAVQACRARASKSRW